MSLAFSPPTLIPSFVVVGKEETVVIEFKSKFASSQELITLDFLDDAMTKMDTSQCIQLGPNTIKVYFPAFSKPGMIEVVPKISRQSNPLFPTFKVYVASPVEAIFSRCNRVQDKKAILSCILSYITHLSIEDAQNTKLQADTIICKLLSSMPVIPQWDLATFLCGGHEDDNLLHFAARYRLDGVVENLAQHVIHKNKDVLWQVSSDKKTPLEIAKKNRLVKAVATLEQLQASYGPQGKKTEKKKKRKQHAEENEEKKEQLPEPDCLSASDVSCRTSTISSSSVPEFMYSSGGTENKVWILKALSDISSQYLYKAKVVRDYQWSSYQHEELFLKVGDIVYVTQEEAEECMGIADLKYGRFPKHVLQPINCSDPTGYTNAIEDSEHYKVPHIQPFYEDVPSSENGYDPIYDIPRSANMPRKVIDIRSRSCSCDTGLDRIETVDASTQQAAVEKPPLLLLSNDPKETGTQNNSAVYLNCRDAVPNLSASYHQAVLRIQNSPTPKATQEPVFQPMPSANQVTSTAVCTEAINLKVAASPLKVQSITSDHEKELPMVGVIKEMKANMSHTDLGSVHVCAPSSTNLNGGESSDGVKRSPMPKPKPRRMNPSMLSSPTTLQNSVEITQNLPSEGSSLTTPESLNCVSSAINSCITIPSITSTTSPQTILNDSITHSPLQHRFQAAPPLVSPRSRRPPAEGTLSASSRIND